MSVPAYAPGSLSRDIVDVLKDAPSRKMKRSSLVRVVSKRRGVIPDQGMRNGVAQALLRMERRGDVKRTGRGIYQLVTDPVPDARAWAESMEQP